MYWDALAIDRGELLRAGTLRQYWDYRYNSRARYWSSVSQPQRCNGAAQLVLDRPLLCLLRLPEKHHPNETYQQCQEVSLLDALLHARHLYCNTLDLSTPLPAPPCGS